MNSDILLRGRLDELEAVIERGLGTFVEVGQALLEIRDSRLYRETHATFEDYCNVRWDLKRTRAYELMEAAEVARSLSEISDILLPGRESHAAELAPLLDEPEKLAEAWAEVVETYGEKSTAADVRKIVQNKMGVHYSSETAEWETPQRLYDLLDSEFGFELDVCATTENAKCASFYTEDEDGLAQPWTGVCWMNPPYGNEIGEWVRKAHSASKAGATVVCLVPSRTDTTWWWEDVRYGEVRFLRGRLKFGASETSAPFPSAVVIFRSRKPLMECWETWR